MITVHGIRTFGNWQERLEKLLKARDPSIQIVNYKYGYFSIFAFIVPFLRWLVTRRFRRDLLAQSQKTEWERIDLVGHSFGTHLIGWGLYGMGLRQRPRIHTIILSGSVLKPGFPWGELVGDSVQRIVNDCGTRDIVLLVNQLAVLFTGMAGREGFSGMTGESFRNRFFELGHSGYFTRSGRSDDSFMRDYWLPLLLTEAPIVTVPDPRAPTAWRGVQTYLFNNAEPIKLAIWITPFVLLTFWVLEQRQNAVQQRDVAVARLRANVAQENLEQRPQRALLLAVEAVIATKDKALPVAREVLHEALRLSAGLPLVRQRSSVDLVAFNPQGTLLATAGSGDGLVYLWDLVNAASERRVIGIEDASVRALVFDNTGQWLAAGGNNGVHLFDTAQFKPHRLPMGTDFGEISTVAFDPQGRWFAASGDRVQIWSLADIQAVPRILDSNGVAALAFEPRGSRLATLGYSRNILGEGEKLIAVTSEPMPLLSEFLRLWDLSSSLDDSVELPIVSDDGFEGGIAFDPLGRWLATGSEGSLLLWNLQAPERLPIVIARHDAHISTIAFDPGGRWLASGDDQGAVMLSSLEAGGRQPLPLGKHRDWVTSLAFDSRGQRLASASADATVRLWNLAEPDTEAIVLRGHDEFVSTLAFDPRDRWLVSGSHDGTARIWQVDHPKGNPIVLRSHKHTVGEIAFDARGKWFATMDSRFGLESDNLQRVHIWDLEALSELPRIISDHDGKLTDIAIDHDGSWLATAATDAKTRIYDLKYPKEAPLELGGHKYLVSALAFDPRGRWLATGGGEGSVAIRDLKDSNSKPTYLSLGSPGQVAFIRIDPTGQWLAAYNGGYALYVWNCDQFNEQPLVLHHPEGIDDVAFAPADGRLSTIDDVGIIRFWDLKKPEQARGELVHESTHIANALEGWTSSGILFDPQGQWLAASLGRYARIWALPDLDAEPTTIRLTDATFGSMTVDRNGQWIAAAAGDYVYVWDSKDLALGPFRLHHPAAVTAFGFDPIGRWLVTGSVDRAVRLWDLNIGHLRDQACAAAGRNLSCDEWRELHGNNEPYNGTCDAWPVPNCVGTP